MKIKKQALYIIYFPFSHWAAGGGGAPLPPSTVPSMDYGSTYYPSTYKNQGFLIIIFFRKMATLSFVLG